MALTITSVPSAGSNRKYRISGFTGGPLDVSTSNLQEDLINLCAALYTASTGGGAVVLASGTAVFAAGTCTVANAAITATAKAAIGISSPVNAGWILPIFSAGQVEFFSTNSADASTINYTIFA